MGFQSDQNDPKYYIDSSIREFLKDTLFKEAFTKEQKKSIESHNLPTTRGNVTDEVFLLSDQEAKQYFKSNADRVFSDKTGWFLRTVNPVTL